MKHLYGYAFEKIRFGESIACKHKGLKMTDVPRDYLEWLSGTNLDEEQAYTVRHSLGGASISVDYDVGI
ncbi:MAG: hypothetical protein KJP19_09555 [Deltaproteobacteria bacterium]|nr:hypothetical protein [Deltaproteobacteria bacterium]